MLMLISMHFCVFVLNLTFDMRYILFSLLSFYVCTNKDKCRMYQNHDRFLSIVCLIRNVYLCLLVWDDICCKFYLKLKYL